MKKKKNNKKDCETFGGTNKKQYLCTRNSEMIDLIIIYCNHYYGSVAQLNRALDYGSRGYRFESCRNHKRNIRKSVPFFYPLNFKIWPLNFMIWVVDKLTSWPVNWALNFDLYDLYLSTITFEQLPLNNYLWTLSIEFWTLWFLPITYETKSFAISIYIIRGIRSRLKFAWIMVWKNMT